MIVCGQHEHMIHEHQLHVEDDFLHCCSSLSSNFPKPLFRYLDTAVTLFLIDEVVKKTTYSQVHVIQPYLINTFLKERKQV